MQSELDLGIKWAHSNATFSRDKVYRYSLERRKGEGGERVAFCMLNPSTADETENDPTIRRCIGFAESWGFNELVVVNLFALRSTDPKALYGHYNPIGPENESHIQKAITESAFIVCAWGAHGKFENRGKKVLEQFRIKKADAWHLGLTKGGQPKHPLYLKADTTLRPIRF